MEQNQIPPEQAQQLIKSAAAIAQKPAENITIAEALQILKDKGIEIPQHQTQDNREPAAILHGTLTPEQIQELLQADENSEKDKAIKILATAITQKAQEPKEEQEAQEPTNNIDLEIALYSYNSKLDPTSPEFDFKSFAAAIDDAGGYDEIIEQAQNATLAQMLKSASEESKNKIKATAKGMREALKAMTQMPIDIINDANEITRETLHTMGEAAKEELKELSAIFQTEEFKTAIKKIQSVADFISKYYGEYYGDLEDIANASEKILALEPFIIAELEEENKGKKPFITISDEAEQTETDTTAEEETNSTGETPFITLSEIIRNGFDENGEPIKDSPYINTIKRAQARQAEHKDTIDTINTIEQATEILRKLETPNKPQSTTFALYKVNRMLIKDLSENPKLVDNVYQHKINTGKKDTPANNQPLVQVVVDFRELEKKENLELSKNLTAFDERVHMAAYQLFMENETPHRDAYISYTQVYNAMGYAQKKPNDAQLKKIEDSFAKQRIIPLHYDNKKETEVYKNYPHIPYNGTLLPSESVTAIVNGKITDGIVHLYRKPPLMDIAQQHKQITTIPIKVLKSPLNKTELNLKIENYFYYRIARMKNTKNTKNTKKAESSNKILLSAIYSECGQTDRKQKSRTLEKIKALLKHYKDTEFIKNYKLDKEAITIYF